MTLWIPSLILISSLAFAADRGEEMRLWPKGAPGSEKETAREVSEASGDPKLPKRFTVVHYPSLFIFLPPKGQANGTAMIVAPGGGHSNLVMDKEGYDIAGWLNKNGIAAFVLKYRLAKAKDSHYTVEGDALADAARAMRTVRSHAKDWGVDPGRIGFMGFSAGAAVAALIETRFDKGNDSASDPIERVSCRPDFAVVVYPGYKAGMISVPKDAPPTFLVCADNDPSHVVTTAKPVSGFAETGCVLRDAYLRGRQTRVRDAAVRAAGCYLAGKAERVADGPEAGYCKPRARAGFVAAI
jgi:dienelactone hydrolase